MPQKREYLGFVGKLDHEIPFWIDSRDSLFHIRVRSLRPNLSQTHAAQKLLESALFYNDEDRWFCELMLVMPDHLHALIHFQDTSKSSMSRIIGEWKRYHTNTLGLDWQENYFDHRLRSEESAEEKATYIRRNPVVSELCNQPDDWPWSVAVGGVTGKVKKGWNAAS